MATFNLPSIKSFRKRERCQERRILPAIVKPEKTYRIVKIPKRGRESRLIYIPSGKYRDLLYGYMPLLHEMAWVLDEAGANFAFVRGRNAVLNAAQHVGMRFVLNFDLKDFFDSITVSHISNQLPRAVVEDCFIDGAPRQGLPTSPLIATIALYQFDVDLIGALNPSIGVRYTRYADDLTVSFNNLSLSSSIKAIVANLVNRHRLTLNLRKTRLMDSRRGRFIISGVGVDKHGVHPTRKTLRKLRAARHQGNRASEEGLSDWSECKYPKVKNCKQVDWRRY